MDSPVDRKNKRLENSLRDLRKIFKIQKIQNLTKNWVLKEEYKDDIDFNIIDSFNKKFNTNYLAPITYDFNKDIKIARKIDRLDPLINPSSVYKTKVSDFQYTIADHGINPYILGTESILTKENAALIYSQIKVEPAKT